ALRVAMEEAQRGLEIVDRRVAGDDDGDAAPLRFLQRREHERARLGGGAGDVDALRGIGDALESRGPRDCGAKGIRQCHPEPERSDGEGSVWAVARAPTTPILRRLCGSG